MSKMEEFAIGRHFQNVNITDKESIFNACNYLSARIQRLAWAYDTIARDEFSTNKCNNRIVELGTTFFEIISCWTDEMSEAIGQHESFERGLQQGFAKAAKERT